MGLFIFGACLGALLGVMAMALCAAKRITNDRYVDYIGRVRKLAAKTEREAKATDDAMKKAKAEGLWEAVRVFYGD